ncbi:MAG: hypothetical protein ACTSUT_03700, partial [Promethearchaeota archaeon]
ENLQNIASQIFYYSHFYITCKIIKSLSLRIHLKRNKIVQETLLIIKNVVIHEGMATKNKIPEVEREKIDNENFELFKSRWPKYAGYWK